MIRPRLALAPVAAMVIATLVASSPAFSQEPPSAFPPPPGESGHGRLIPVVVGAVIGAYVWPLLFPAVAEVAVVEGGSTLGGVVESAAALPAAAAESAGVIVPETGVSETVVSWRLNSWYPAVMGAIHGAYAGFLVSR